MSWAAKETPEGDLLDVRQAAAMVDRHPETIRRRIWSGKLPASRRGNKLLVTRGALESEFGETTKPLTLAEWTEKVLAFKRVAQAEGTPEGDKPNLVLEEREARWRAVDPRAGR